MLADWLSIKTLPPRNDPHCMDDTWDITQKSQQYIEPEVHADTDLKKNPQGWQQNG